jgi:hypothetical protein
MQTSPSAARDSDLTPVHLVRDSQAAGKPSLWVKQPEAQDNDTTLLPARLCSCSDVCLAVIDDLQ